MEIRRIAIPIIAILQFSLNYTLRFHHTHRITEAQMI